MLNKGETHYLTNRNIAIEQVGRTQIVVLQKVWEVSL